ncbi:hypothetical protein SKAU_G00364630 [Synaphobranchus kaupii]|uniref:Uncharacterized protein n=1 Tax=Synaphobranchus kaupii TaxID=118154 RepID=A0A9Q1EEU6_SYNKA|nr:hypothetical protein SKAU_G00364630 [Synaphobranchus kaupii]
MTVRAHWAAAVHRASEVHRHGWATYSCISMETSLIWQARKGSGIADDGAGDEAGEGQATEEAKERLASLAVPGRVDFFSHR